MLQQQQNYQQFPDVKQELVPLNYRNLPGTSRARSPPQPYTPSPNMLQANSFSRFDSLLGGHIPNITANTTANFLNNNNDGPNLNHHNQTEHDNSINSLASYMERMNCSLTNVENVMDNTYFDSLINSDSPQMNSSDPVLSALLTEISNWEENGGNGMKTNNNDR